MGVLKSPMLFLTQAKSITTAESKPNLQGQLWSWGRNNEGQLGRPLAEAEFGCSPVPRPLDALSQHHVGLSGCLHCLLLVVLAAVLGVRMQT